MSEPKGTCQTEIEIRKAEQNALYKYAAIKHAEGDVIGAARIYVDITGDWEAALVLDELMFWTLPKSKTGKTSLRVFRDGFAWLAVQRTDWWERKRLTARQADGAIKKLVDQDLVVKELFKFNAQPTTHLRLNVKKFFELLMEALEKTYKDEEDQGDLQDIQDLYEMMGMPPINETVNPNLPNGETDSPNGETDSPNGEMINSPYQPSHSPHIGAIAPIETQSIDNQIFAGVQTVTMPVIDEFAQRRDLAAMQIIRHGADLEPLALAAMDSLHAIPSKREVKGWATVLREMKSAGATPENIKAATDKLRENGMTVADPWGLKKTVLSLIAKNLQPQIEYKYAY